MKLMIATPSNRDFKHGYVNGMISLALTLAGSNISCDFRIVKNMSDIVTGRTLLVEQAISAGFTHILFVDDDMEFSPGAVKLLLERDVDFVGANCLIKGTSTPSARIGREPIYSKGKTGIEKINKIGMAFTLIKISAFEKIQRPYFESNVLYNQQLNTMTPTGEDTFLCLKFHAAGIEMYVDHDAARLVKHVWDTGNSEDFS